MARRSTEHVQLRDNAAKLGYRFLSLSVHGTVGSPRYTAVMIKRPVVVAQRDWPSLTFAEFQNVFDEQAKQGYGPVMIAAVGSAGDPRFAAVFQPQSPIPLTRHGLRSGAADDLGHHPGDEQEGQGRRTDPALGRRLRHRAATRASPRSGCPTPARWSGMPTVCWRPAPSTRRASTPRPPAGAGRRTSR